MRPRIPNSYNSRRRTTFIVSPVLSLACEGRTEALYSQYVSRGHRIRLKPKVFTGDHGQTLIEHSIAYADRIRPQYPEAEIIPAVIYDLEGSSNQRITEAINAVNFAKSNGVKIWVNIPSIERWFVLHYSNFSMFRSARQAEITLNRRLSDARLPTYRKPGSARYYTNLTAITSTAIANCSNSHIDQMNSLEVPCMCDFINFLNSY